jgi:hypothetical protein
MLAPMSSTVSPVAPIRTGVDVMRALSGARPYEMPEAAAITIVPVTNVQRFDQCPEGAFFSLVPLPPHEDVR